jgi:hypothetical protein
LKGYIYSTFSNLKKKGFATSVYAFRSKFYGTYFDYQNNKKQLQGNRRPFYIWIIGNKDLLRKFNSKVNEIATFHPEKSLHFGFAEEPVTKYDIISQIERVGNWMKGSNGIENIVLNNGDYIQFCVGLNLKNLPDYAKDTAYIRKNLILELSGCEIGYKITDKLHADISHLKSQPQKILFEKESHLIIFKVKSMNLSTATLKATLPLKYDTWYTNWSCMEDRDILTAENKTFAFEYLILGVKEAYETSNKNYIDFLITLNK